MFPAFILVTLLAFLLGALPFAVWLGRRAGHDPRRVGDGNPGATNALRSGGWKLGLAVLMLDVAKAALPVGLAYQVFAWRGGWMWTIAMAPVIGHAFSPFLGGRGGKGVASALGVWIGLTLWRVPLAALPALLASFAILTLSGWAVLVALLATAVYLLCFEPEPLLLAVLAGQAVLLAWKYRSDLRHRPRIRRPRATIGRQSTN
ncbi:MAG: glycerol-3-phosphate acyltransferase [Chloroflexota bacterium]